jgi:hypothetical protein
MALPDAKLRHE